MTKPKSFALRFVMMALAVIMGLMVAPTSAEAGPKDWVKEKWDESAEKRKELGEKVTKGIKKGAEKIEERYGFFRGWKPWLYGPANWIIWITSMLSLILL
ncbi:MAG: hypothetical protein OEY44_01145, partial [Candidatus Peregrinibacteria bacterium]|nr:hypothetical protein [Candidatus Peregrinibacteria bacterium]